MYPVSIAKVSDVLGGHKVLGRAVRTFDELAAAVADGLPREVVGELARHAAPEGARGRIAGLVTSPATFKRSPRLSPQASERAERLARVTALATEVLEDADEAREWLTSAHPLLGHKAPIEAAGTDFGAREVERILHNIDHGLPV
jgi:putative toxin-antitoxin system antitoxin component (TIGR02293 family)